ncbi:MAG: hypothetical protein WBA48_08555 [Xanthobacteraceae bacterium]
MATVALRVAAAFVAFLEVLSDVVDDAFLVDAFAAIVFLTTAFFAAVFFAAGRLAIFRFATFRAGARASPAGFVAGLVVRVIAMSEILQAVTPGATALLEPSATLRAVQGSMWDHAISHRMKCHCQTHCIIRYLIRE